MKGFVIGFGIVSIVAILILAFSSGKGIVQLEGYAHAVAFCGCEIQHVVFDPSEATVRYDLDNDITYVINKGHEKDIGVIDLMGQAEYTCNKLKEEQ